MRTITDATKRERQVYNNGRNSWFLGESLVTTEPRNWVSAKRRGWRDAEKECKVAEDNGPEALEEWWIKKVKLCAMLQAGNKQPLAKRHDESVREYGNALGWHYLIKDLQMFRFRRLEYFYKRIDGKTPRWEDEWIRRKEAEWEERKVRERQEADRHRAVQRSEPVVATEYDQLLELAREHGPQAREVRAFAHKHGIKLFSRR